MKFEKTFEVDAPQQAVWDFITDPGKVAACMPGCAEVERLEDNKHRATLKTRVGPIATTFTVEIETREERPPDFASYMTCGAEGSRAAGITALSALNLESLGDDRTAVTYRLDLDVLGRLGKLGGGLAHKVADSMGDRFIAALRERIEAGKP